MLTVDFPDENVLGIEAAVEDCAQKLASKASAESLAADPYWPKWDSPWWHMSLLWELGMHDRIPAEAVERMTQALNRHYLPVFPFEIADVPAHLDPQRAIMCHCGAAIIYQILRACGVDVEASVPWIRPWFTRYQLPDGGFNCDEAAYVKAQPRSSVVSTLPVLEALLFATPALSVEEEQCLDRGAQYLIRRRLCRSVSRGGDLIDANWLSPVFPRFYQYDVLRGLRVLAAWARRRGCGLPGEAVEESMNHLGDHIRSGRAARDPSASCLTLFCVDGRWERGRPSTSFPLLDATRGRNGGLQRAWNETVTLLRTVLPAPSSTP